MSTGLAKGASVTPTGVMEDTCEYVVQTMDKIAQFSRLINSFTPSGEQVNQELDFYQTVYPDLKSAVCDLRSRVLELGNLVAGVLSQATGNPSVTNVRDEYPEKLQDILDQTLENVDNILDELSGWTQSRKVNEGAVAKKRRKLQLEEDPKKICVPMSREVFVAGGSTHPFESVIDSIVYEHEQISPASATPFQDIEGSPAVWVDDVKTLREVAGALRNEGVLAVDLENHSYHSYHGFSCLMQISTASADYLIDVIKLRAEVGQALASIFSDPKIVKVFHGAQSDIAWLQRDFNIFVVNLFDTFVASKALEFSSHSLASLLFRYVGITVDKQFQLADWRIRPLGPEMLKYAQMDTHYLLHVYDRMRLEIYEKLGASGVEEVFRRSAAISKQLYKPDVVGENSWKTIVNKSTTPFSQRELQIIKSLFFWREKVARYEDESPPAVLPNYMLVKLTHSSFADPEVVLKSGKANFPVALRNLLSLRQALRGEEVHIGNGEGPVATRKTRVELLEVSEFKPAVPQPAALAQPSVDPVETQSRIDNAIPAYSSAKISVQVAATSCDDSPVITVPTVPRISGPKSNITMATCGNGSALANLFSRPNPTAQASVAALELQAQIVSKMMIAKVGCAAKFLHVAEPPQMQEATEGEQEQVREHEQEPGPDFVLPRTGQKVTLEELEHSLVSSEGSYSKTISMVKSKPAMDRILSPDLQHVSSISDDSRRLLDCQQKLALEFDPTDRQKVFNWATNKPQVKGLSGRLGANPQSGNRSKTYRKE